ncbi:hypothetical protein [Escherichia coli]|nr:hypothetical protein [Escherichia coli]MCG9399956.1 hypothetical protein [Escherichia coli]MCG9438738.1 hypothetical protein [Escherichia coli]MDD8742523.1 hypothetical protein [Escherichia coli]MDD8986733.1 hypothetical protein [Escherichia coli]
MITAAIVSWWRNRK